MSKQELKNDTLIRALLREPTDYTPVWFMRQAGRYLPEYRELRKKAGSFLAMAKNPDYATEVTLQPIRRFPLDAAILFSDILTIPDAMGLGLHFVDGEGPKFERPLMNDSDIRKLHVPSMDSLRYVFDAVSQTRNELGGKVPLIGFAGSPWTLACYMIEGGGSKDFHKAKTMLYKRPELMHHILEVNANAVSQYLNAQIEAGVQAVMIFDSWGGILSQDAYRDFSLYYIRKVLSKIHKSMNGKRIPSIIFTKGGGQCLGDIAKAGADAVGIDWMTDISWARGVVGNQVSLQGNLDPAVLLADDEQIKQEVMRLLSAYGKPEIGDGHVFNLGHGISQFTDPEAVAVMVDTVHAFSRSMRR
jgi:uroporphyrinogen decarboxylase